VSRPGKVAGHVFISYVREDSHRVDQLQQKLEAAGIPVWRDTADLWPGEDWRAKIRRAITDNALVFIACFSSASSARYKSYQNEELTLAMEQMRRRNPDDPWLIPVRFDECEIPDRAIGGGRTLPSIQRADLFGDRSDDGTARLVAAIQRILGGHSDSEAADGDHRPGALTDDGSRATAAAGVTWLRVRPWPRRARPALMVAVTVGALLLAALFAVIFRWPGGLRPGSHGPSAAIARVYSGASYGFNAPNRIADDGTHVWVTNPPGNSVTELNASDGSLVRTLTGASYGLDGPVGIAVGGAHVWVANTNSNSVTELNASDGSLVRTLTGASYSFGRPYAIAVDGTHVWVANNYGNSVTELNASDGSLVRTLAGASYSFSYPAGIAGDSSHIWVANSGGNSVTEVNASDGSWVATLAGARYGFYVPRAIALDGTHVWVANVDGNSVTELNASDGSWVATLAGASYGFQGPWGMAADGTHVWVTNSGGNSVTELTAG